MDPVFLIFLLLVVLFLVGVEILTLLGVGAVLLTLVTRQFPLTNISITMFDSINLFPLIALPLFVITGDIIAEGGIAQQIMQFARALVGWMRGGLVLATMVASGIFAAISGSNSATVATIGRVVLPDMKQEKYPADFAAGSVASGGVVGIIIPPSIAFVLYGVSTGVSVGDLFIAGILPGLLMVFAMCVVAYIVSRRNAYGLRHPFSWGAISRTFWGTKYALGAIALILVGIYSGIFTPTEAGAVASVYCLFVGMFITRKIGLRQIPAVLDRSASLCGLIAPVIALALVFSQNLAILRIPDDMVAALISLTSDRTLRILIILGLLLVAGCVMETAPNILLLAPILAPLAERLALNPIHFGVIVVCNLAIGFITPPVGLNLYVASAMSGVPFTRIAWRIWPYIIALVAALLVITFVPWLSLAFVQHAGAARG
ncbi:MAG TPA: TRAP transporter large permease [Usitatibacter sp.]|jgi:C4-dicarboxylate transporter DctM subunit|nr:TRAP transporter large permease [Usitatibacter sp.]